MCAAPGTEREKAHPLPVHGRPTSVIRNTQELTDRGGSDDAGLRALLVRATEVGFDAVDPERALLRRVRVADGMLLAGDARIDLGQIRDVLVVGAGKASAGMAAALASLLGPRITGGLVVVPEGLAAPRRIGPVDLVRASHPLPAERGRAAMERMLEALGTPREDTLVLCVISGGGSALLPAPREGVTLDDKRATTDLLLASGAPIGEINAVRKHLSALKGGGLARRLVPATVVTFLVSDVPGDVPDAIASGPTLPDPTTYRDALATLERYGLQERASPAVVRILRAGAAGRIEETPKPGDPCFARTHHVFIARNQDFLGAASAALRASGCAPVLAGSALVGEAREAGRSFAAFLESAGGEASRAGGLAACVAGGETTVRLVGRGSGGRNQEAALAAALAIEGRDGTVVAVFGTDGIDGPTDAAGAIVDGGTVRRARERGLDPADHLRRNDSHPFFRALGDSIRTGLTGTNVGDVALGIAQGRAR